MSLTMYAAIALCVWNVTAFAVAAADKRAARRAAPAAAKGGGAAAYAGASAHPARRGGRPRIRRVPERRFIFFAATLGGAGVLLAFYMLRHKTRHASLLFAVWALTMLSYSAALYILIRMIQLM